MQMNTPQIRIKAERFRAISEADIIVNGITVVAGENGSGKSTLSKFLYYLFKTASNYEQLVSDDLRHNLRGVFKFLEIFVTEIRSISNNKNTSDDFSDLKQLRKNFFPLTEEVQNNWIDFLLKIETNFNSQVEFSKEDSQRFKNRLQRIAVDVLKEEINSNSSDSIPFDKIIDFVNKKFSEANEKISARPNSLFLEELKSAFREGGLPEKFEVLEFNEPIASDKKTSLSIPYSVQNVIYIDTPMSIGNDSFQYDHWQDLNDLLQKRSKISSSSIAISQIINTDIISGEASFIEEPLTSNDFLFSRSDGSTYNLIDVATGIKSFAILQILLNNGLLNDKTLLIIDEPESHLHPQWIIEYARIIVLLNKQIGVKFFVASHNPDMISALKYISQKEGTNENVNFYLAEKIDTPFFYKYKHLSNDIDPIFESFNIAIERINKYGGE